MLEDKDRTPDQIERVLDAIRTAWSKYPHFGLGQLLFDAVGSLRIEDLFYAEDEELIRKLGAHDERVRRELE
jgi:hypothetical protein